MIINQCLVHQLIENNIKFYLIDIGIELVSLGEV
jgi:hypothetical protein